ncbi:hypothetical protein LTR37_001145 [Vermiconidia calcicola]|uniref:Uncharacterized protein n=1 Tax=Vermiconidia calcicola TaxID=1690605 RepID=A0ACC3NX79_9PEZI|nr:hypothetical protein LTR37_001145 [Vermiconidia calcicola]
MESSHKRRKLSPDRVQPPTPTNDEEPTDFKLAILASMHPDRSQDVLLDYLLAYGGSVEKVSDALSAPAKGNLTRKRNAINGYQSSLASFAPTKEGVIPSVKPLTKKGRTLHLYSPEDVENHTPCSIIHNFLPTEVADALLQELLGEAPTFKRDKFQMFERAVESPHTVRLYVDSYSEIEEQNAQYTYNGGLVGNIGKTPTQLLKASALVQDTVNKEAQRRISHFQPNGEKLKFQSPDEWRPNASFVNCYNGGQESVGWHSDHLTYLGPRAIIGSLSLGVARQFRVRKIVPQVDVSAGNEQGQIAIHLPHNSLLVMHAEMQEAWKHSIAPAKAIDPHPVAGNQRINVTYPAVLRCVQKQSASRSHYFWQCHAGFAVGQTSCGWFAWAEFDEDGKPPWADGYKGNANIPASVANGSSSVKRTPRLMNSRPAEAFGGAM